MLWGRFRGVEFGKVRDRNHCTPILSCCGIDTGLLSLLHLRLQDWLCPQQAPWIPTARLPSWQCPNLVAQIAGGCRNEINVSSRSQKYRGATRQCSGVNDTVCTYSHLPP